MSQTDNKVSKVGNFTCIYCGRRGSRGFYYVTTASNDRERAEQVACDNREACERRQEAARHRLPWWAG